MFLIAAILADLGCWRYGQQYGDWWPLVIAIPGGPAAIWLHRHGLL